MKSEQNTEIRAHLMLHRGTGVIHSTPIITIARRFLIAIPEYRYRRKSLYTSTVAGTVKLDIAITGISL